MDHQHPYYDGPLRPYMPAPPPHSAPPGMQFPHAHHSPLPPHMMPGPRTAPPPIHPALMQRAMTMERQMRMHGGGRFQGPHALQQWQGMVANPNMPPPRMGPMGMGMGMGMDPRAMGPRNMGPHGMHMGMNPYFDEEERRRRRRRRNRKSRRRDSGSESSDDSEPGFRDKLKSVAKSAAKGAASAAKQAVEAAKDAIRGDPEEKDEEENASESGSDESNKAEAAPRSSKSPHSPPAASYRATADAYRSPHAPNPRSPHWPRTTIPDSERAIPPKPDERVPIKEGTPSTDASGSDGEMLVTDNARRRAREVMATSDEHNVLAASSASPEMNNRAIHVDVPESYCYIVERMGKYNRQLKAGRHAIVAQTEEVAYVHSLKDEHVELPPVSAMTHDGVCIIVTGVLAVRVVDPVSASYAVDTPYAHVVRMICEALQQVTSNRDSSRVRQEAQDIAKEAVPLARTQRYGIQVSRADIHIELSNDDGDDLEHIKLGQSWYDAQPNSAPVGNRSSRSRRIPASAPAHASGLPNDDGAQVVRSNSGATIRARRDESIIHSPHWA